MYAAAAYLSRRRSSRATIAWVSWTPLLTGDLAERAVARAREIAVAQAAMPSAIAPDRVLYWAYTCAVFDEPFANDAYGAALDDLVASLGRGAPHLGLFGGLTNAAWVLCHTLDADDSEESLAAIDEALLRVLGEQTWTGAHDLIEGLVGFGVYFLERLAHGADAKATEGLARVTTHLDRTATKTDDGATWHTPLSLLPPSFASEYPDGFYDCGIAHGVPGMIGFLARASTHVPQRGRALALEARRWLEATATGGDGERTFPGKRMGRLPSTTHTEAARTAWCYGDPGVAVGLWWAERAFGHETSSIDATELALRALRRDMERARVVDATLCHGAAGLGHISNRFFHATRDAAFAEQARTWFARALELPIPSEPAFLDGSAGVGLALLAATTASEPAWDRLLLTNLATDEDAEG